MRKQKSRKAENARKKLFLVVFLTLCWLFSSLSVFAQTTPYERIFFCIDQTDYCIDDTLSVEGLIVQVGDTLSKAESRYVNLQIFDNQDSLCINLKLRCNNNGGFLTTIPCHALWKTGPFLMRAYTRTMCNYAPETFPIICFTVSDKGNPSLTNKQWLCSEPLTIGHHQLERIQNNITLLPETGLEIRGRAVFWDGRHPVKEGHVLAYQRSTMQIYEADTDKNGYFCLHVEDYLTGEEFYLQATDNKGKIYRCDFSIDNDFFPMLPLSHSLQTHQNEARSDTEGEWKWNRTLPEIIVRAKKKYDRQESKHFYKNLVLTGEDLAMRNYLDLDQAIPYFSPYIYMKYGDKTSRGLYSRRSSLLSGATPVKIVVDGVEMSYDECNSTVNISDCESIEYVRPNETLAVPGVRFALGGALVIKTKRGKPFHEVVNSNGQTFILRGIDNL